MKHHIIENWKTSLSGICVFGLIGLYLFDKITKEQMETAFVIFTGAGFILSKDSKKNE